MVCFFDCAPSSSPLSIPMSVRSLLDVFVIDLVAMRTGVSVGRYGLSRPMDMSLSPTFVAEALFLLVLLVRWV